MTRFFFALFLIEVFFASVGFIIMLAAGFSTIATRYSFGCYVITFILQTLNSSLMTAAYVRGRNRFNDAHRDASLGKSAFALMWAAVVLFLLTIILMLMTGAVINKASFKPTNWELPGTERRERNRRMARIRKVTDESRPSNPPIYSGEA